jgi:hypothetical protein
MKDLAQEDTQEMMRFWYEQAVEEQKKELRDYKKKAKIQLQIEPVPPTIEIIKGDQSREDRLDPIEA